jgi:hypothetical protein
LRDFFFPLVRGSIGKIDEHTSAANPAAAAAARQYSSICGLLHRRRTARVAFSHLQAASVRRAADASTAERDVAKRDPVTRRAAMKTLVVRLVATLALALATTTAAFAQSRPPSCIPQYDASGAQVAPYCGP